MVGPNDVVAVSWSEIDAMENWNEEIGRAHV